MAYLIFKRKRYIVCICLAAVVLALIIARIYLDSWALSYVNRTLNNIPGYQGSVEDISIRLYRGAYKIYNLKLDKKNGNIPTPFVAAETVDISVQWAALFRGRIVSNVDMVKPVINFAVKGNAKQTGQGVDWTRPIKDLSPIDINLITFTQGKLSYQDFSASPKVNLYIHNMHGEVRNLRNVEDKEKRLPSSLLVRGDSIGKGKLEIKGNMNILRPVPDLDLDAKLEHVHLPALSNYTDAYAAIDIEKGTLSVYSELIVKNNRVTGYIKPIAKDVHIISTKDTNPIKFAWEAVVATVVSIFTNHREDQFATQIPLEGNLDKIDTDSWAAIGGIIRNAFVRALKQGVDSSVKY